MDQTVIYILSESFSDPRKVEGVELTENPIPNIGNIMKPTRVVKCIQMAMVVEQQYGVSNFNKFAIL